MGDDFDALKEQKNRILLEQRDALTAERDALRAELDRAKSKCVVCGVPFGAHGSEPDEPCACIRCSNAVAEVERLRVALSELLRMTNTIEVLGEWEATDVNRSMRAKNRALVDACIERCRAALAHGGGA